MKAIILLSVLAVAFASECGENQHYESCGTACPITCENYENPPKVCVLMCNPGCHCDEGYVKTEDGSCVEPAQCPAQADSRCSLQSDKGRCRGYIERYYYNQKNRRCEKFIYGGCGGNRNNFKTRDECRRSCGSHDHGRDNGHNHGH